MLVFIFKNVFKKTIGEAWKRRTLN